MTSANGVLACKKNFYNNILSGLCSLKNIDLSAPSTHNLRLRLSIFYTSLISIFFLEKLLKMGESVVIRPIWPIALTAYLFCLALLLYFRFNQLSKFAVLLTAVGFFIPVVEFEPNHAGLILWCLIFCQIYDFNKLPEAQKLYQYLLAIFLIFVVFTGFQKLSYGTYFEGQFFAYMISKSERFSDLFKLFLPSQEFQRVLGLKDSGKTFALHFWPAILMGNFVYLYEVVGPLMVLNKKWREFSLICLAIFIALLQIPAREYFFAILFMNFTALFLKRNLAPWMLGVSLATVTGIVVYHAVRYFGV